MSCTESLLPRAASWELRVIAFCSALLALIASPGESPATTAIRDDGLLDVNGEVIFPVGLLELGIDRYPDWNDRIRRSGANLVWDNGFAWADSFPSCVAIRDSAEATGYKLLVGSRSAWEWDDPSTPELEVGQPMYDPVLLSGMLDRLGSSPAFVGFANRDEPVWVIARNQVGDIDRQHVFDTHAQLHDAAPGGIVAMNFAPVHVSQDQQAWKDDILAFRDATDIVVAASYPYPAGPGTCSAFNVIDYPSCRMDRLVMEADILRGELSRPDQPLWMIVQAFKGIPRKEARWEAYASIVHGATGVLWGGWAWIHPQGDGEASWPVIEPIIAEVASLHDHLIAPDLPGVESDQVDVEVRGKQTANTAVVFAVSRNDFTGSASIFLPALDGNKVEVVGEDRTLRARGGWIQDEFDGYEAHVYRYTKRMDGCTESVPGTPSSLTVSAAGSTAIDLAWSGDLGAAGEYVIERTSNASFAEIARVPGDVTTYADTGLACAAPYAYRVKAVNCAGESGYCPAAAALTDPCPSGTLVHVAGIDLTVSSQGPWQRAHGTVTIVDAAGAPVAGAIVGADWTGMTSSSESAITGVDGTAAFTSERTRVANPCWTLTVTDVTGANLVWDPTADVESSDSIGGGCVDSGHELSITANAGGEIRFSLPSPTSVRLAIFDVTGRRVRVLVDGPRPAGGHVESWDGRSDDGRLASPGVYFVRLETPERARTVKTVLVR